MIVGALGVVGTTVWGNEIEETHQPIITSEIHDFVLSRKKISLEQALSRVERHFGVSINYPHPLIRGYQVRTAFRARTAADAVGVLLMGLPFVFEAKGEYITIAPREVRRGRGTLVLGRVVDEDRMPLSGIRIEIFGLGDDERRQSGTLTNAEGEFHLNTTGLAAAVLKVSGLGRETHSIVLRNPDNELQVGTIILPTADVALNEVIVTPKELVERADREIVYPEKVVDGAVDGIELLEQLRSPSNSLLPTDVALTEETFAALNVHINGRRAQLFEVRALRLEAILRIEYLFQPGESDTQPYAINLITRPHPGVAAGVDVTAFCFDQLAVQAFGKVEKKKHTYAFHYESEQSRWTKYRHDEMGTLRTLYTEATEPYRHKRHNLVLTADYSPHERHRLRINVSDDWQRKTFPHLVRAGFSTSDTLTQRDHSHRSRFAVNYEGSTERRHRWLLNLKAQHHSANTYRHFRISGFPTVPFAVYYRGLKLNGHAAYRYQWRRWGTNFATNFRQEDYRENQQTSYLYNEWHTRVGLQYAAQRWMIRNGFDLDHTVFDGRSLVRLHPQMALRFKASEALVLSTQAQSKSVAPTFRQRSRLLLPLDPYRSQKGSADLRPTRVWTLKAGAECQREKWNAAAGVDYTYSRLPIGLYWHSPALYVWRNGRFATDLAPYCSFDVALWSQLLRWRARYAYHLLKTDALSTSYHDLETEISGRVGAWQYGLSLHTERRSLQGEMERRTAFSQQTFLRFSRASWTLGATFRPFLTCEKIRWRNALDGGTTQITLPNVQPQLLLTFQWRLSLTSE